MKSIAALAPVLVLTILSFSQARAASPVRRDSSGAVYMAAVTMKDASGREVLITGMSHIAPAKFYSSVEDTIKTWVGTDRSSVLVMREFITCSTQVLDNPSAIPQSTIDSVVAHSKLFDTPVALLNAETQDAQPIIDALKLKPADCRIDLDHKTKRPSYIIDRNEDWCSQTAAHGVACQFNEFNSFLGTYNYIDADLQMDSMSPAVQIAAASLYRTGILGANTWNVERMADSTRKFLVPGSFLLIQGRNQLLMAGVINAFKSNVKRILIPWGAEHTVGLVETLQTQGFHVTSVKDELLGDIQDIGKLPLLDLTLTNQSLPASYGIVVAP